MAMRFSSSLSNYLQEVDIMNSHFIEHFSNEHVMDVMQSIEFFIGAIVVVSVVSFICLVVA